jgi:hypothetical protein
VYQESVRSETDTSVSAEEIQEIKMLVSYQKGVKERSEVKSRKDYVQKHTIACTDRNQAVVKGYRKERKGTNAVDSR